MFNVDNKAGSTADKEGWGALDGGGGGLLASQSLKAFCVAGDVAGRTNPFLGRPVRQRVTHSRQPRWMFLEWKQVVGGSVLLTFRSACRR